MLFRSTGNITRATVSPKNTRSWGDVPLDPKTGATIIIVPTRQNTRKKASHIAGVCESKSTSVVSSSSYRANVGSEMNRFAM